MRAEASTIQPACDTTIGLTRGGDADWFAQTVEYDANAAVTQKYIYGPGVDQPICMIDVADSNAVYYYHYDALGSVVALSDSAGDTVQLYEYDVYGQPAASDPNHTNPFLFTGRRYDTETGLYYYRARYYNPSIGRFLQTDPIGYSDGMNMYRYCRNNSLGCVDPSGRKTEEEAATHPLGWILACGQTGKSVLTDDETNVYEALQLIMELDPTWERKIKEIEDAIRGGLKMSWDLSGEANVAEMGPYKGEGGDYRADGFYRYWTEPRQITRRIRRGEVVTLTVRELTAAKIWWNPGTWWWGEKNLEEMWRFRPPEASLAHELTHLHYGVRNGHPPGGSFWNREQNAVEAENRIRQAWIDNEMLGYQAIEMREFPEEYLTGD